MATYVERTDETTYTLDSQKKWSHSRRSAALRDSLPSSLPMSSPGNGGVEEMALRVASAAATPVKGITTPPATASSFVALPRPGPVGVISIYNNNDTK